MSKTSLTDFLDQARPIIVGWIEDATQFSPTSGGGGAPSPHGLDSSHHTGTLVDSQAPQFLKTDGTRALTGNLGVSVGVTIDGVDISELSSDYQGHIVDYTNPHQVTLEQARTQDNELQGDVYFSSGSLGIGVSPSYALQVRDTSVPQVQFEYDASNYGRLFAASDGDIVLSSTGSNIYLRPITDTVSSDIILGGANATNTTIRLYTSSGNPAIYADSGNLYFNPPTDKHTYFVMGNTSTSQILVYPSDWSSAVFRLYADGDIQATRIGVGVHPTYPFMIRDATTSQLRLEYDATTYTSFTVNSSNRLLIANYGQTVLYNNSGNNDFYIRGVTDNAALYLQSNYDNLGTEESCIYFYDYNLQKYIFYKDGNNDLRLYDTANTQHILHYDVSESSLSLEPANYISQTAGWAITGEGNADFRYIFADELHVRAFIADIYQAVVGGLIITEGRGRLSRDFTIPNTGVGATIYFEDLEGFEGYALFTASDYVLLRVIDTSGGGLIVADVWGQVTSYTDLTGGEQSWTFTTTTPSYTSADTIYTGAIALGYGSTGSGVWMATVMDAGNSPYSQVETWSTVTSGEPSGFVAHTRVGNLDGISGIGNEYGLWAGEGTTNTDGQIIASDSQLTIRNSNLSIHDGTNFVFEVDRDTPSLAMGSNISTMSFTAGAGLWVGYDSPYYKFRVGDPDAQGITWDGVNMDITGSLTVAEETVTINNEAMTLDRLGYSIKYLDNGTEFGSLFAGHYSDGVDDYYYTTLLSGNLDSVTMTNPGFESVLTSGWTTSVSGDGSITRNSSAARSGSYGCYMWVYGNVGGAQNTLTSSTYSASPNDIATLVFYYKISLRDPTYGITLTIQLDWIGAGVGSEFWIYNAENPALNDWTRIEMQTDPAPTGTTGVRVIVDASLLNLGQWGLYFDDFELNVGAIDGMMRLGNEEVNFYATTVIADNDFTVGDTINMGSTTGYIAQGGDNRVRIGTDHGYVDIGPLNTSWTHYTSSLGAHYFYGDVAAAGDFRAGSGIASGDTSLNPSNGDIMYTDTLVSYKGSASYEVWGYRAQVTPYQLSGWAGSPRSTMSKTQLDMSSLTPALPTDYIYAYRLKVATRDSASSTNNVWGTIGANNTASNGAWFGCAGNADDEWVRQEITAKADSNGDIWIDLNTSGSGTCDVVLQVLGYYI